MSSWQWMIGLFAVVPMVSGCAVSQKLVTPPLYLKDANILYCTAVNLDSTVKIVDINVFDEKGMNRCGAGPYTIEPGHTATQVCNSDLHVDAEPVRYCVFTYEGLGKVIVASGQIDPPKGSAITAVQIP